MTNQGKPKVATDLPRCAQAYLVITASMENLDTEELEIDAKTSATPS
jgi:hypothetical protein